MAERHREGARMGRHKNQERFPRLILVPRERHSSGGRAGEGDGALGKGMEGSKGKENQDDPNPSPHPDSAFPVWGCPGSPAVLHHHPPAPLRGRSQGMQLPSKSLCCGYFWPFLGCYFSKNPTSRDGTRRVAPAGGSPELLQASLIPPRTSHEPELSPQPRGDSRW